MRRSGAAEEPTHLGTTQPRSSHFARWPEKTLSSFWGQNTRLASAPGYLGEGRRARTKPAASAQGLHWGCSIQGTCIPRCGDVPCPSPRRREELPAGPALPWHPPLLWLLRARCSPAARGCPPVPGHPLRPAVHTDGVTGYTPAPSGAGSEQPPPRGASTTPSDGSHHPLCKSAQSLFRILTSPSKGNAQLRTCLAWAEQLCSMGRLGCKWDLSCSRVGQP